MKRFTTFLFVAVGAVALAGLGYAYLGRPDSASTAPTTSNTVVIRDYAFHPATFRVAPGTTVTWVNRDPVAHTVTGKDGNWGSGLLAQGQEFSYTFSKAGTYEYFCQPHPWMEGRIVVGEAADQPTPPTSPAPPADANGWREQMQEWMDRMHGPGSFDAMRKWMEERWGPGAWGAMLQSCPYRGEGATTGGRMMDGQGPPG